MYKLPTRDTSVRRNMIAGRKRSWGLFVAAKAKAYLVSRQPAGFLVGYRRVPVVDTKSNSYILSHSGPFGVRSGLVRAPFGVRLGSVWGPVGVRSGSVGVPFRFHSGSENAF